MAIVHKRSGLPGASVLGMDLFSHVMALLSGGFVVWGAYLAAFCQDLRTKSTARRNADVRVIETAPRATAEQRRPAIDERRAA
jgi:hypothetical protein